jgi:hypothetical protein
MQRGLTRVVLVSMIALAPLARVAGQAGDGDQEIMRALDGFLNGWNSRDAKQFASALHFPHVVFEGGNPRVTQSESEFVARGAEIWATAQPDWDRSVWEERRVVQRLPGVVHVVGRWARLDKAGKIIGRADVLYVVANKDGRWAIAARSGSRTAQGALKQPQ